MIEDLLRDIILNGISPVYDKVYQDLLLLIGFLILTIAIEVTGFWIIFRKRCSQGEQKDCSGLHDMMMAIFVLNFITFLIGGILYLLL